MNGSRLALPSDPDVTPVQAGGTRRDLTHFKLADRYLLEEMIGGGAMGTVYAGRDLRSDRRVAVKVLDLRADRNEAEFEARFTREATLTKRLSHPNIVEVLDSGKSGDVPYLVMELLEGRTLAQVLEQEPQMPWLRAVRLFRQMCEGLAFAHELGLMHRDLKPANCFVVGTGEREQVKLLDFGLAKAAPREAVDEADVTRTTTVMGSPSYMAPEQARGEATPQSDLYSFGVILYRMLAGTLPFNGRTSIDVIVSHLQKPVPWFEELSHAPTVPIELELVVRRCLEKDPRARFASVKELEDALDEAVRQAQLPPSARKATSQATPRLATGSDVAVQQTPTPVPVEVPRPVVPAAPMFENVRKAPRRSMGPMLMGVGFLLTLGATAFVAWNRGRSEVEALPQPPPPVPAPAVAPPQEEPVPPGPHPVLFRINSIPTGATVRIGAKKMGETPVSFEVESDSSGEATAELTLELKGYQTITFITTSAGPKFDLVQRLTKGAGNVVLAPVRPSAPVAAPHEPAPTVPTPVEAVPAAVEAPLVETAKPIPAPVPVPAAVDVVVPADQLTVRPRLLSAEAPKYSSHARLQKVSGSAVVKCIVGLNGLLRECRIVKSVPLMDEAVLESMATRRYEPGRVGAQSVASEINIPVRLEP